jgi:hypothetical protein
MGKPGSWNSCSLKVDMKTTVYIRHNGLVDEEPADQFKQWMDRRPFDPEHGKNEPETARRAPEEIGSEPTTPR